jgi:hypothetical protein
MFDVDHMDERLQGDKERPHQRKKRPPVSGAALLKGGRKEKAIRAKPELAKIVDENEDQIAPLPSTSLIQRHLPSSSTHTRVSTSPPPPPS